MKKLEIVSEEEEDYYLKDEIFIKEGKDNSMIVKKENKPEQK